MSVMWKCWERHLNQRAECNRVHVETKCNDEKLSLNHPPLLYALHSYDQYAYEIEGLQNYF